MAQARTRRQGEKYDDFGGGVQTYVSPLAINKNESPNAVGFDVRNPGIMKKIAGFTQRGTAESTGTTTEDIDFTTNTGAHYSPTDEKETDGSGSPGANGDAFAQSITTTAAGTISSLQLYIKYKSSPPVYDWAIAYVWLCEDDGGSPGTVLDRATVSTTSSTLEWVETNLSAVVTDATTYWIVVALYSEFATVDYKMEWGYDSAAGYAGGSIKSYDKDGDAWSAQTGDLNFKITIQESGSGDVARVKGLGVYRLEDGTETMLRVRGALLDEWGGSAWAKLSTGDFDTLAATNVEMVNSYTDDEERIYMTCEHADDVTYYNGTTTAQITDQKARHIANYKNKLYLGNTKTAAGTYPNRVQFSAEGADTFGADDFFDDMGEPITALQVYGDSLYIFTENKMSAYDGYSLRSIAGSTGTVSGRSVRVVENVLLFYNQLGVYAYAGSGKPQLISRAVEGYMDVIETPTTVGAGLDERGRYCLWIGNITYKGESLTNVKLVYDFANNAWDVRPNSPHSVWANETDEGTVVPFAGSNTSAAVYQVNTGTTADGGSIYSAWQSRVIALGNPENLKNNWKIHVTFKPSGESEYLTVEYRMDGATAWSQIGGTDDNIDLSGSVSIENVVLNLPAQTQGKFIEFRITHTSTSGGFEIYEIKLEADEYATR